MQKITPFLWFAGNAEEAMNYYCSIFPDAKVTGATYYGDAGPGPKGGFMLGSFELLGQKFTVLNGNPDVRFSHTISFVVNCESQEEVDHYWNNLTANGGEEVACGWLKDKYGMSWQITPVILPQLLQDKDAAKSARVMKAMMQMKKIDIAALEAAAEG